MGYDKMFQSLCLAALIFFPVCNSADTLTPFQSVRDGETLVSAGKKFALGFFSPGNSKNRYVGIWYNKIPDQAVVWTANRENPVGNSLGILTIKGGNLVLLDGGHNNNITLWSTNVSSSTMENYSSVMLTDSGNLVLTDGHQRILWESFDHPTNTLLPGMKLGLNRRTGLNRILTSWKSADDPAAGEFSLGLDPVGVPQYFLRKGSDPIWRSGPWNGQRLSGVPLMNRDTVFSHTYVTNDDETYLMYHGNNTSINSRLVLDDPGLLRRLMWNEKDRRWNQAGLGINDRCDRYANCGAYGSCDSNRAVECECLRGFEPKTNSDWNLRDWSGGCVRKRLLDCDGKGDGFLRLANVKVPDTSRSWVEPGLSLDGCKEECLKNCSCTAYASADIREGGHGCLMWDGDLVDLRVYSDGGQDVYTRVSASELDENTSKYSRGLQGKKDLLVELLTIIPGSLLFVLCGYYWWRKVKGCEMNEPHDTVLNDNDIEENVPIYSCFDFLPNLQLKDNITPIQSLRDGETIISAGGNFVQGFFSPGNSKNRYLGIWYNKISDKTVVWTANRENPIYNSSGILTIKGGNLVLLDGGHNNNITLWSTNVSSSTMENYSSATLTDSGNLVLIDGHQRILWESFDHPTNTLLPGMKLGLNRRTGVPQFFLGRGSDPIWRSVPWNGERISGFQLMNHEPTPAIWSYVANDDEIYSMCTTNSSIASISVLDHSGLLHWLAWNDKNRRWNVLWSATQDRCDGYANCGANGCCDSNRGCVRRMPLDCDGKGDGFVRLEYVKLPDTSRSRVEPGLSLESCKEECLKNCNCTAYASADISEGGGGGLTWDGDLIDLPLYSDGGQDIYTRGCF
ncbi:hypothetical protein MRB53_021467 [Persea americana]|uniref:Uncharacterized protein n=1 Tax=Persea americana TaxID=3435 RepID=A0ACC2L4G5_PERAE|nr:hypothetical protein MRB53_021467 [Persea americana]